MSERQVPFFNYPSVFTRFEAEFVDALQRVGRSGAFIMQKHLHEFEASLADYAGVKYALGVGNATDALELILMADGIQPGDEVIMSAHTMIATASAVRVLGGVPVPVDIADDRTIDVEAIEAVITEKTRYIMPTHLNGRIADMHPIKEIADRHGLKIVEDAAQSLGARYHGQHGGSFDLGGCISFYPAKVLGCLGDGGAILTNDERIYKAAHALRDHGRSDFGVYESWGRNSRLDNLQAEFLNVQMPHYPDVVTRRRAIAARYFEGLSAIPQLGMPVPPDDSARFDIFQNFEITAADRDGLKAHMASHGVGSLNQWGGLGLNHMHQLGLSGQLPKSDAFFESCIMIPLNYSMCDDDVDYVIDVITQFYA